MYKVFHPTVIKPQDISAFSVEEANFWAMMLEKANTTVAPKLLDFLKQDHNALLLYETLRNKIKCIHYFSNDDKFIRKLWFKYLFWKSHDFPIYCALIRNELIPEKQLEESHDTIIKRLSDTTINDEQFQILKDSGFWDRFREYAFTEGQISQFNWANSNSNIIIQYLERFPINEEIATTIQQTFCVMNHPWTLRDALNELFSRNTQKRKDLLNTLSNKKLDPPPYLSSLKNHDTL